MLDRTLDAFWGNMFSQYMKKILLGGKTYVKNNLHGYAIAILTIWREFLKKTSESCGDEFTWFQNRKDFHSKLLKKKWGRIENFIRQTVWTTIEKLFSFSQSLLLLLWSKVPYEISQKGKTFNIFTRIWHMVWSWLWHLGTELQ